MGNFKATALTVAVILGVSSFASQHHGTSPDLLDHFKPSDGVLEEPVVRFNHSGARTFSSLVFDVTRGQLIAGARDYLFRLSLDGLALLEESRWSAEDEVVRRCQDKGQWEDDCHNFVRVLHIHGDRVLACGTNAFSPSCSWRPAEAINNVSEWLPGVARCPYGPHSRISSLLSSGPAGTADLYIGSPTDFSGQDVAIFRLPLNSSTSADSSAGPQRGRLRTMQYNAKWLDAAEFVGSVEADQFVFFFFREAAVEFSNCGKAVYSRVARVCKNDVGGGQEMLKDTWTTFVKARLNCSVPAEYPFYYDHIQSVAYVEEERLFYAAFTTAENSIAGSAVCSFTLESIQESFAGPFWSQTGPSSSWESVHSTHARSHCNSDDPSRSSSSSSLLEAEKYQLMDRAVQPRPARYGSGPLIRLDSERFNHIAVDAVATKIHPSIHVLYVASRDGLVRKYSVLPSTQEGCLIESIDPFARFSQPADRQMKTMQFLKEQNALYIGTESEVIRLASRRCKRFASRAQCLQSMDPYCGWQSELGECSPPPYSNPHVSYSEQNFTTCPISSTSEKKGIKSRSSSFDGDGGVCDCNESSIIAKQGAPGPPGVDGKPGMTGMPGAEGQMGPTGPEGPAGEKGERGDSGSAGKEGPSGPKGEPGRDGLPGNPGDPGLPGAKGDRGTDGEMGPKGDAGEPGLPGTKGDIGPVGPVGTTSVISSLGGAKGNQGDRGKRGKPGPPGPPGPPGTLSGPSKSGSTSQDGDESQKGVVPGIVTVTNMEALFKISDISPVGTIAYLYEEESLLVRVRKGWQYISMGNFVPLPTPMTIPPPTTLKPSDNRVPKIAKIPSLRLVALNEPLSGNMGGIQRVDYACFRQARQAGLGGTFRAFLASRIQKLDKIVRPPYRGHPVVNLRGEVLFRTWNDLFRGGKASEFASARQQRHDIYSFNNRNIFNDIVWPQKVVWHGAGPSGERQLDSYCDAWTSSDAKTLGVAASLIASSPSHQQPSGGGKLLAQDKFSCQNRFVVLCIEATSQGVPSGRVKRAAEHISGQILS